MTMQTKNDTKGSTIAGTGTGTGNPITAAKTNASEPNNAMMDGSIKSSPSVQQQPNNIQSTPTSSSSRPSSAATATATTNTSASNNNNNNNGNIQSSPSQSPHTMISHTLSHHPNSPLPPAPTLSPPKQQHQSSYDQSSLHSYDSHPSPNPSQQQQAPPYYHNRSKTIATSNVSPKATSNSTIPTSYNYNGVIQGMEMLEKQQLKWEEQERKRRIVESSSNNNDAKKLNEERQLNWKYVNTAAGGGGAAGYYYNNGLPLPPFPKGLPQDQYNTNSVGGSGVGAGGGQYPNYQLSREGSGNSSNRGVPQTVHVNGDYDDVSESLMDEGGGGNTNNENNGKKKDEMKRVNSIGKFLKTPLVCIMMNC